MEDVQPPTWKVEVSRRQKRWALLPLLCWLAFAAFAAFGAQRDWAGGRWDTYSLTTGLLRILTGVMLWAIGVGFNAKILKVNGRQLEVTTRFRPTFLGPKVSISISEAALEWIDDRLVIQQPNGGPDLRLAQGPQAHPLADWLVARGASAPVGG